MSENMSEKLCLFAGTTEGRQLAELLGPAVPLTVCVATEYGEVLLDGIPAAAQDSREDTVGRTLAQTRFMSRPI